jgi:hypothetical protein
MNHLQSLLNIPRILSTPNIENELERIAKVLMNEFYIYNGTYKYRPVEIEFYIYHKDLHADEHVYKRDKKKAGDLFYHYSGFDICFKSSFNEGFFGGILIRAIERVEDNTFWGGPLVCKNEVLNTAKGKCKLIDADKKEYISLPATERKGIKKSNELDLYWNKKYRFVREGINNPIEMTITDFQFKEKHIKERKNKYYL